MFIYLSIDILICVSVSSENKQCLPVMLKWGGGGKSKVFPPFPRHRKFQDQGPNCLNLPPLILHCLLLTQRLFSSSAENTRLNYRAGYEIATLSCLLWLFSLKQILSVGCINTRQNPPPLWNRLGKVYQLWAPLEQTFWPGSTKHSSGQDEVPGNSSPHVSILMETYRRVAIGESWPFPQESGGISISGLLLSLLLPLSNTDICPCFLCLGT